MFGSFTPAHSGNSVFTAFMENDGEFVLALDVDGVEVSRWTIPEGAGFALAEMLENNQ